MTAAIVVLVWTAMLVLFLIANYRWSVRMEAYDKAAEVKPEWVQWHPGTERSTKTGEVRFTR